MWNVKDKFGFERYFTPQNLRVLLEYFDEENVPLPIEKTKRIIHKCTDDDFNSSAE